MQFTPNICIGVLPLLSEKFSTHREEGAVVIVMKWKANDKLDPMHGHPDKLVTFSTTFLHGCNGRVYTMIRTSRQKELTLIEQRNHLVDQKEKILLQESTPYVVETLVTI